ncbi:helix-turn-helix domain-containing protein [Halomonas sp. HL-93]|uniref:helix-turn-helix domain-containing protein n=1 Tax=Halomonas sp. HL-93 TaxID=1666906 RepID=UPI0006DB605D|nr:helix-turn-helix transcriptional regulator [Halomonas sp. HL-93]KPQ19688.1 MAG: putative transcriptional regulator [Halomonas sp. HL-93]SBR52034.1 Transcriptional regulator, contains XRE-family HTH domain [Halomonas sp. HL-93]
MEIVSSRFRAARKAKRLNQMELAERIGVDQARVSRVERGERGLTRSQLLQASKVLDVSVEYLMGLDLGDNVAEYTVQETTSKQAELVADQMAPTGLRELAIDQQLTRHLQITTEEWHALSSIVLPGEASRDGYVQLLFTIRAICYT